MDRRISGADVDKCDHCGRIVLYCCSIEDYMHIDDVEEACFLHAGRSLEQLNSAEREFIREHMSLSRESPN